MKPKKISLSETKVSENNKKNKMGKNKKRSIKNNRNIYPTPRSYRITFNELNILRNKAKQVSKMVGSNIKITDALMLRSLIRLSETIKNQDIFEEIKNIRMEI